MALKTKQGNFKNRLCLSVVHPAKHIEISLDKYLISFFKFYGPDYLLLQVWLYLDVYVYFINYILWHNARTECWFKI